MRILLTCVSLSLVSPILGKGGSNAGGGGGGYRGAGNCDPEDASEECEPCFARSTHASRLHDQCATAQSAFDACFGAGTAAAAERVPMPTLRAGDLVLTAAAGKPAVTRVVLNQHVADDGPAPPVLTLHHARGTVTLTEDHVLAVGGAFASARDALVAADGEPLAVERVEVGREGVINPITVSGTILAAGPAGVPVLASVYGDWIAYYFLATHVYPLPLSLSSALAYFFPAHVQGYYDAALEPAFIRAAKGLKVSAKAPWPVVALIIAALDVLLAAGFVVYCVCAHVPLAAALAVSAAAARRTKA
jgi:hypothetical protein